MKKNNNEVAVGVFVIVGFIFLTLVLFFVSGVYLFRSGYTINVLYEYVDILNKGAPVRMAGVRVGEVSDVQLYFDETKQISRVKMKLFIEKGIDIRENYQFSIRGTHVLSEPHIEITPKSGNAPLLLNEAVVEGFNPVPVEALMGKAHEIMDNLAVITGPEGDVRRSLKNMESASTSADAVLSKMKNGEGTVGQLLMKDGLYNEMDAFVKDLRAHPWKLLKKDSSAQHRKWYFLFLA